MKRLFKSLLTITLLGVFFLIIACSARTKLPDLPKLPALQFAPVGTDFHVAGVELLTDVNGLPKEGKVFKLKKPNNSDDEIIALANKFGIKGSVKTDGMGKAIEDGIKSVRINNTGGYDYLNKSYQNENFDLEEAKIKADKYIKDIGILEKDFYPEKSEKGQKSIFYYRRINGVEVYGVSRIVVNLSANGEIESVIGAYRNIDGNGVNYPLKDIKQAISDLKSGKGSLQVEKLSKGNLKIKRIELVYWEDPVYAKQPYIQPVYEFSGEAVDGNKRDQFAGYVSAVDESYFN